MHRSNTRVGGGIWYLQSKKRYPEHSDAREVTGNFNFTNEGWKEEGDGTTGWASNRSGKQPRGGGNIRVISSRVRRAQSGRELEMVRVRLKVRCHSRERTCLRNLAPPWEGVHRDPAEGYVCTIPPLPVALASIVTRPKLPISLTRSDGHLWGGPPIRL